MVVYEVVIGDMLVGKPGFKGLLCGWLGGAACSRPLIVGIVSALFLLPAVSFRSACLLHYNIEALCGGGTHYVRSSLACRRLSKGSWPSCFVSRYKLAIGPLHLGHMLLSNAGSSSLLLWSAGLA